MVCYSMRNKHTEIFCQSTDQKTRYLPTTAGEPSVAHTTIFVKGIDLSCKEADKV